MTNRTHNSIKTNIDSELIRSGNMDAPRSSKVIVLESDARLLATICSILPERFSALRTGDPARAEAWLIREPVYAAIAGAQPGDGRAVKFLLSAARLQPEARRILITGLDDLGTIVTGLHSGAVQHIVQSPPNSTELLAALGVQPSITPLRASKRSISLTPA